MSDLIRREDAIKALTEANLEKHMDSVQDGGKENRSAIRIIMGIPTADVVEVVRCKECKYSDIYPKDTDSDMPLKCLGIRYGGVMPDWYCEHAERKTK